MNLNLNLEFVKKKKIVVEKEIKWDIPWDFTFPKIFVLLLWKEAIVRWRFSHPSIQYLLWKTPAFSNHLWGTFRIITSFLMLLVYVKNS